MSETFGKVVASFALSTIWILDVPVCFLRSNLIFKKKAKEESNISCGRKIMNQDFGTGRNCISVWMDFQRAVITVCGLLWEVTLWETFKRCG